MRPQAALLPVEIAGLGLWVAKGFYLARNSFYLSLALFQSRLFS
jgi:hypothetical protein